MLPTSWDFAKLGLDVVVPGGLSRACVPSPSGKWGGTQASRQNPGSRVIFSALSTFNLQQHQLLVGHCTVVGILFRQVDAPQADVAEVFFAG